MADVYRSPAHATRVRRWCRERLAEWPVRHDVEVVGTTLGSTHLTWAGAGDDAVCLYLPGTNFNAATSVTLLSVLGARWPVVCADLPGQPGLSACTRPRDETASYARWVGEVIDHVRRTCPVRRLVLIGHSRGAAVALSAEPSAVDGLVLASPAGLAKVALSPAVLWCSAAWVLRPTPSRSRRLVDQMAAPRPGEADLSVIADWMTTVASCTRTTGAPGPLPTTVLDRWRGVGLSVLVGEQDVFFPPARLAGPARRLGVDVQVVAETGHLVVDQQPGAIVSAVSQLLA